MMGEPGDEEQLLGFLNAVLKRTRKEKLVSVEIIENRTITAETIGDKTSILDVRAKTDNGTKINVEVQLKNLGNMDKRSLFYWSRDYTHSIEAGDDYKKLPNVIAINIVNFEYLGTKGFHSSFHLREDIERDYILTDTLEIHFIDMVKFKKLRDKDIKNDPLQRWLAWFDRDSNPEILQEVVNMDAAIQQAEKKMTFVSSDKEALRAYQMREMALSDWTSGVNYAIEEKTKEIARKMKKLNISKSQIQEATGISMEEIESL
jgi:predicted transposase/invertase (TIGR01784 family)